MYGRESRVVNTNDCSVLDSLRVPNTQVGFAVPLTPIIHGWGFGGGVE